MEKCIQKSLKKLCKQTIKRSIYSALYNHSLAVNSETVGISTPNN